MALVSVLANPLVTALWRRGCVGRVWGAALAAPLWAASPPEHCSVPDRRVRALGSAARFGSLLRPGHACPFNLAPISWSSVQRR